MRYKMLAQISAVLILGISIAMPSAFADNFLGNKIIDDAVFDNANSMSPGNINSFLNQFQYSCISPNSGFEARIPTGYSPSGGFTYGSYGSAGDVIYTASQVYHINPQVLIATLEKEQSLVTGRSSSSYCSPADDNNHKYAAAVGYGCPDSGTTYSYSGLDLYRRNGITQSSVGPTCVNTAQKAGFSQQVIRAAWLLKFGQQRSEGNVGWAVISGSWNNSDDPQTCYAGPMTQGNFQRCPSGSTTYYDGYLSIDGSPVHMDNGATAALYWYTPHFHGNQVFFNLFSSWFGSTLLPAAFKTSNSNTVYLQANGYKFMVPSMGLLQDYGISPGTIQTVSQSTADSIPNPDAGIGLSSALSYIVKSPSDQDSDGGAVYLISVGKRYGVSSLQQFNDFGMNVNNISYLPLNFIMSINDGGLLSNFIQTPSQNAFQVNSGSKRIFFDYPTYSVTNPSGFASFVSGYTASLIPSGMPIVNREVLVSNTAGGVYLLSNGAYYLLPSPDVMNCWGFTNNLGIPLYKLFDDSFVSSITNSSSLGCTANTNSTTSYVLNGSNKVLVPQNYGFNSPVPGPDLLSIINRIPQRSTNLQRAIKKSGDPTVWYFESGLRKTIPSIIDFNLLAPGPVDTIYGNAIDQVPMSGIKLGPGQVVKTDSNNTVYVVMENGTRTSIASADEFIGYSYSWNNIESFPASTLDTLYPSNAGQSISRYLYDQSSNKIYVMDPNGCYYFSPSQLTSFGLNATTIQTTQTYLSSNFPYIKLGSCPSVSLYVKAPGQSTVYWVDSGQKHPFISWSSLQSFSHEQNPRIINLSPAVLTSLPQSTPI